MKTKRLLAFFIDWFALDVCYALAYILMFADNMIALVIASFLTVCFFAREGFTGQGLGKRMMQLEAVPHSPMRLFLRNLTLLIWPLELVFFLIQGERIGDLLFKCHIVEYQGKKPLSRHNIVLNIIIIVLVTLILSLVLLNLPKMRSTLHLLYSI